MPYLKLTSGQKGALHPLQIAMLERVHQYPGIGRLALLELVHGDDVQMRRERVIACRPETPKSGPSLERYLDALVRQSWLREIENVITYGTGLALIKHYELGGKVSGVEYS